MSARTHYLNARRTLQTLLGWRVVPVINENDTTTTDEISFGDNDFLAAQVAVLLGAELLRPADRHRRALHGEPARATRARSSSRRSRDPTQLGGLADRPRGLAARLGRDALQGRRGGDGDRRGDPDGDRQRPASRACWRARGRASASGTRFAPQAVRHSSFKLWLKYAKPSHGTRDRGRRRRAGAARRRDEPPAGRDRRRRRRVRRGRRRRGARGGRGRDRQGDRQLLGAASCAA